jgi:hypothetical protein
MGSLLDIFTPGLKKPNVSFLSGKISPSIRESLRGDWNKIGQDFYKVIDREKEHFRKPQVKASQRFLLPSSGSNSTQVHSRIQRSLKHTIV